MVHNFEVGILKKRVVKRVSYMQLFKSFKSSVWSFSEHDNEVYLVQNANNFSFPRLNLIGARRSCNVGG